MNDPLHLVAVPGEEVFVADEAKSFEDFFRSEMEALYRTLCFVTRNRHDAFVRVLERWERVGRLDDPRAYLYRTAMNTFRSRYRRALLAAKRTLGAIPPDDAIAAVDERDVAVRALATLSPRQRAAVVLIDVLGFPSKDAGRMLGIRPSTVRMHASRAHAALKEAMTDA